MLKHKRSLLGTVIIAIAVTAVTAYVLAANAPPPPQEVAALPDDAADEPPEVQDRPVYKPSDEWIQQEVEQRLQEMQERIDELEAQLLLKQQQPDELEELFAEEQAAAAAAEEKIREILAQRAANASGTAAAHQLAWPYWGKGISAGFGSRSQGYHSGIDIQGPMGDSVAAAEAGEVVLAEWYEGYGNLVIIDHGSELQTYYGHLSAFAVAVGDIVERGQVIGAIGSTGRVTEPQLHFEVRNKGAAQDPLMYLENEEEPEDEV